MDEEVCAFVGLECLEGTIGAKSAAVEVHFAAEPDLPLVLVDRVQIQQVLVNLLRNTVEAMAAAANPGGGAVFEFTLPAAGRTNADE